MMILDVRVYSSIEESTRHFQFSVSNRVDKIGDTDRHEANERPELTWAPFRIIT